MMLNLSSQMTSCDYILLRVTPYRDPFFVLRHQDHHSGPTPKDTQYVSDVTDEEEEVE